MDVVADLHVHTTVSDGRLTLADLPDAATRAGVDCVAVTDHDRVHPGLDAPVTVHDGLTVVRGVELRVDTGDQRLDLLGYGVRPTDALTAELDRIQRDRVERARRMVECVEARLGVDLRIDLEPGVGRPHVARAVDASEADHDFDDAFDGLIGNGDPCYVAREVPSVDRGLSLLHDACSVVSLAHPFRYDDPESALALAPHLDAVERYYPYGHPVDEERLDRALDAHGLLPTGGSDAHDLTLGVAGLDREAFGRFASHLPDAQG